jgi:phosphoribosyl-AMP cyclohydrolase
MFSLAGETVKDNAIETTSIWTRERWYWKNKREYWYKGQLKIGNRGE